MTTSIDLIIPAFNESPNIDPLFEELAPLRERGIINRVVLADNNSTDDTPQRAASYGAIVVHEKVELAIHNDIEFTNMTM